MSDPNNSTPAALRPVSPCINICSLDEQGYCRGCYRTIEEIAAWSRLTAAQQWTVVGALGLRARLRDPRSD
ncbi:MAG: DUF1289 domain-containing protein [Steroidobacteraceae bacterium]